MLNEFKKFALQGNMVDLAVGIVIGAAFGTVVSSLVADVITPLIAALFQAPDFSNLFLVLRNPTGEPFTSLEQARAAGAVVLGYGTFLNAVVSFLVVSLALFLVVKGMNRLLDQKAENARTPSSPTAPNAQEVLLADIRDLLRQQMEKREG